MNRDGLDLGKLGDHKKRTGSVIHSGLGTDISNKQLLELDVDILVPAALENSVTMENADLIKAKLIAEFANGPVSAEADDHLAAKGVPIVPDFLCNAGGVIVSYFEIVQNRNIDHWNKDMVQSRLMMTMTDTYRRVAEMAKENRITLRRAAYSIAMTQVVESMKARGWV